MRLIDTLGKCSIEIERAGGGVHDPFMLNASVDIGHGVFKGANADVHFLNLEAFVRELDAFIMDRARKPRLEGTYDSYIEFSGSPSRVAVSFCVGDAFSGYASTRAHFAFTGAFEIEQDFLSSALEQFRGLL